ncbi:MAG TPA: DUF4328 domain-containing protein [Actinomycetota bacterium]|nr:DUF4328 domain-containing protein [Actinomycetota bacterium]
MQRSAVPRSTGELAPWLQAALGASAVLGILNGIDGFLRMRHGTFVVTFDPNGGVRSSSFDGTMFGARSGVAGVAGLLSIVTIVLWLIWQHRATSNLWAWGRPNLRISPGWAVAWWFIPFANLVMPFRAVRELDRRSPGPGAPFPGGPLLGAWWATYLLGTYTAGIAAVVAVLRGVWASFDVIGADEGPRTVDLSASFHAIAPWTLVGAVLTAIAAVLAILVVRRIEASQTGAAAAAPVPPRPDVRAV